jgi:glycosyltransferase involved in cell wall biosynthesis
LAQKGHEVFMLLLSYRYDHPMVAEQDSITWLTESIRSSGPYRYFQRVREFVQTIKPDWIVGFSDTYYGILAEHLGKKFGIHSAIDAYDNYESYIPWLKPLHLLWRRALNGATVVTAAGPQLAELLGNFRPGKPVRVVPMAADPGFKPLAKAPSRRSLRLPSDKKLVGYCGSIYRNRGVDVVFQAFESLCRRDSDVELILTGRKQRGIRLPPRSRWLGYLPDQKLPLLLNSMDVLLVVNMLSAFGSFSYPAKLYEAMSCCIPVVATATAPARWILCDRPQCLAAPGDSHELADKICNLLPMNRFDYGELPRWETSSHAFEEALLAGA